MAGACCAGRSQEEATGRNCFLGCPFHLPSSTYLLGPLILHSRIRVRHESSQPEMALSCDEFDSGTGAAGEVCVRINCT